MITVPTKQIVSDGVEVSDKFLPYAKVCQRAMHDQDYIKRELRLE